MTDDLKRCILELKAKQSKLNDVACEKEELQRQLCSTSKFIEHTINKHRTVHSQLADNYNVLFRKYQNKKKELDKSKGFQECLNNKIDELNRICGNLMCQLKEHDERKKCLEEEYKQLKQSLIKERNDAMCIKSQNENQKVCLERTSKELTDTKKQLNEKINEFNKIKEEHHLLKSKLEFLQDELLQKVEKCNLLELRLTKYRDITKTEIQIQKYHNIELEQYLCEQKNQLKELIEMLAKASEKINALNQTIEKERIQTDNYTSKIRQQKLNVENENVQLQKNIEENMDKLKCLQIQNDEQRAQIHEFQYRLDAAIKCSDEKQNISAENMKKIVDDIKLLKTEIISKNRTITQQEEQLLEVKKLHKTEAENVYNLQRKLECIKYKPNQNSKIQLTDRVSEVLDELKLEGDTSTLFKDDCCTESSEDNNQGFEKLITKCNSLINHFNK